MTYLHEILMNVQSLVGLDKASLFTMGYACYLYIVMDGTTKSGHSRRRCSYHRGH